VSEHLEVLREAGLITETRRGHERHYAVQPEPLEGRGTRFFLEHRGFYPDDPIQQMSRTIMSGG
jgi:DNA-binding transcriptional ArsR family regulator